MKKLLAAVTVLAVSTAQAATIHIDIANCPGPGDGSVGDPYCSIQTAINNAVDTDEIVVAPGTYFEAINFLGKAVTLRSSDGAEVTVIDGTGNFHVVQCVSGEGPDTVLDGFTITGGNANGSTFPDNIGGGMLIFASSPTVADCTPAALPSDLNGDGLVGIEDFLALLAVWGSCSDCGTCPADFDGDCSVGILDLLILLGNWG